MYIYTYNIFPIQGMFPTVTLLEETSGGEEEEGMLESE
jgi:hypothetical protein